LFERLLGLDLPYLILLSQVNLKTLCLCLEYHQLSTAYLNFTNMHFVFTAGAGNSWEATHMKASKNLNFACMHFRTKAVEAETAWELELARVSMTGRPVLVYNDYWLA